MDTLLLVKTVIMGLVEGLTEFLPISSTGHLILASELLGFGTAKGKVFEIVIQTGAMLAIVWEYRTRFTGVLTTLGTDRTSRRFAANVVIAVIPAVLFGLALGSTIKAHLFRPVPVALAFVAGGIVILWAERRQHRISVAQVDDLTWRHALKVGCIQCLALIPGTSRAGATIIGGLWLGLSRRAATEFSFFLAVPTLVGAGVHQLYTERLLLSWDDMVWFAVGSLAAFIAALLCVRWLMRYISTHDFTVFAWYRIVFGLLVLATSYTGVVDWTSR